MILPSCTTPGKVERDRKERAEKHKEWSRSIKSSHAESMRLFREARNTNNTTPDYSKQTEDSRAAYYGGLIESIRSLDKGHDSAETIARRAVDENLGELRSWKRAQLSNIGRLFGWTESEIDEKTYSLPSKLQLDEATSLVLRYREEKAVQ